MQKPFFIAGAIFGLTAVILGAFGAHALSEMISPDSIKSFETGVKYQMYHALLLLILGMFSGISPTTKKLVFYLLILGIVLFSGSIYLLATNSLTSYDFTNIALLTPLGGTLLILAWAILLIGFVKTTPDEIKKR